MNLTNLQHTAFDTRPNHPRHHGKLELIARRFLIPRSFVSLYALLRWHATISTRAEVELSPYLSLGRGTTVSSFTKIKATDGVLATGEKCGFGPGCFIAAGPGGIQMGHHVIFGPNVSVIAVNYAYGQLEVPLEEQGLTSQGIQIGSNVWVGASSVILDGSEIGDNSIIVANSLVNRKFPPNSIIQGNPAKVILARSRN
jgi:acetyltransferase-like isoleucine patch superfamily enzyme